MQDRSPLRASKRLALSKLILTLFISMVLGGLILTAFHIWWPVSGSTGSNVQVSTEAVVVSRLTEVAENRSHSATTYLLPQIKFATSTPADVTHMSPDIETSVRNTPIGSVPTAMPAAQPTSTWMSSPAPDGFKPFDTITVKPDFELNGQGRNVDSIAFWQAPDPHHTLMFITAKNNQLVEIWKYPFDNELPPLRHASFGSGTRVNGVAVDQKNNRLYVSVSEPASTVSVFSLPELEFIGEFVEGDVNLESEPNITLLKHTDGQTRVYVSADSIVYIYDGEKGTQIGDFRPAKGLETLMADDFYQVIYIPDENDKTGIYAYYPDGTPYSRDGTNNFGVGGIFRADAEGIVLYTCPADGSRDNGTGLLIVAEQKSDETDFEFFDRQTLDHLGTVRLEGVSNTDGIASTQKPLPDYPSGVFVAVNDDTTVVGVDWDKIFDATGLGCGTQISR